MSRAAGSVAPVSMSPRLVVVLGPTGVGKSRLAVELALRFDGEIINADSQQVYRGLDIGTAKPGPEERARVPHHLIDIVEPDEEFDAARYRELAARAAREIAARGRAAIVCGGTGLYIKALLRGLFRGPARDPALRESLAREAGERGIEVLYRRLREVDPEAARAIHPHDRQRIVRALEVFAKSGKRFSEWHREHAFRNREFEALKIGLDRERAELYRRIDQRCEAMVSAGLVEEVRGLVARGHSLGAASLRSVGYRHIGFYLTGKMTLDRALEAMKRDTRRLAKRQLTWFRADPEVRWFHPEREREGIFAAVAEFLSGERAVSGEP
jgi:tRNA dimethylallyltransferase